MVMKQTYVANAKILATDTKNGGISSMLNNIPTFITGGSSTTSPTMSMLEIISSRTNAEYIYKNAGLDSVEPYRSLPRDEQASIILEQLSADTKRNSGIILVDVAAQTGYFADAAEQKRTAELAARICNTAIEGLDKANREKSTSTARKTRMYIERVLGQNRLRMDSLQSVMVSFQNANHVFTPEKQADAMVSSAVAIGTELSKAETELRLAREQYQNNTPLINALESKVTGLRSQFSSVQNGGLISGDKLSIPVGVLPDVWMRYLNMLRDIKILEQVNAYLESQRMQEAIQEERDVPTIQIVDSAIAPLRRSAPSRTWMVCVTIVVSSLLSVFLLMFRQALIMRKQSTASAA